MIIPILVSFAYRNALGQKGLEYLREIVDSGGELRMFLDSGAFTQFTAGKKVDLDEYCDWLYNIKNVFSKMGVRCEHVALDVVGDQIATHKNYKAMLGRFPDTLPVFTRGGSLSLLKSYLRTRERVALGGLGNVDRTSCRYVRDLYSKSEALRENSRKVHWFGFTNKDYVATYRPGTVDSSEAFVDALRFKKISMYQPEGRLTTSVVKGSLKEDRRARAHLRLFCERYGFNYEDLANVEENWIGDSCLSCIASMVGSITYIQKLIRRTGTVFYMAVISEERLISVREAIKKIKEAGDV